MTTNGESELRYGYTVHMRGVDFETAKERTIEALKHEGFGVLTQIDLAKAFKEKLGVDFRRYEILGACNPALAHRGVQADIGLGLLLPCNVALWAEENGTVVALLRPAAMFEAAESPAILPVAEEAEQRIGRVFESLRSEARPEAR